MSSFFKASCFIFWLTWLICFAFMLGTKKFIDHHVMEDDKAKTTILIMQLACVANVTFSFIGCIFLKCDIHHVCCAGLYMICLIFISPGLSIWGSHITSKNTEASTPSRTKAKDLVKDHFKTHSTAPYWLTKTEVEHKCCGINGPEDYREWYRSLPTQQCEAKKYDIPESCCPHIFSAQNHPDDDCLLNGTKNWREQIALNGNQPLSIQQKCDKSRKVSFQINKKQFNQSIYGNGCYLPLKVHYQAMTRCLYVYFIILMICSVLMMLAYGRSVYKSSRITGEVSSYSLDIETVSELDLPSLMTSQDDEKSL